MPPFYIPEAAFSAFRESCIASSQSINIVGRVPSKNDYGEEDDRLTATENTICEPCSNFDGVRLRAHPHLGFSRDWAAVLNNWKSQATLKLGGKVEPAETRLNTGRDIAIVSDHEQSETSNAKSMVEQVRLRATNIFPKEGRQWKVVAHHTDPLAYLTQYRWRDR